MKKIYEKELKRRAKRLKVEKGTFDPLHP